MQGVRVRSLVGKLRSHVPWGNWARTPQLLSSRTSTRARVPQTTEPTCPEARTPQLERSLGAAAKSLHATTKTRRSQKKKKRELMAWLILERLQSMLWGMLLFELQLDWMWAAVGWMEELRVHTGWLLSFWIVQQEGWWNLQCTLEEEQVWGGEESMNSTYEPGLNHESNTWLRA